MPIPGSLTSHICPSTPGNGNFFFFLRTWFLSLTEKTTARKHMHTLEFWSGFFVKKKVVWCFLIFFLLIVSWFLIDLACFCEFLWLFFAFSSWSTVYSQFGPDHLWRNRRPQRPWRSTTPRRRCSSCSFPIWTSTPWSWGVNWHGKSPETTVTWTSWRWQVYWGKDDGVYILHALIYST